MYSPIVPAKKMASVENCTICISELQYVTASRFCFDCSHFLCGTCSSDHHGNKTFNQHFSIEIDDMECSFLKCKMHVKEFVKLYCSTCDCLVCHICMMKKHCSHVTKPVQDFLAEWDQSAKVIGPLIRRKVVDLETKLATVEEAMEINKKIYEKCTFKFLKHVEKLLEDINKQKSCVLKTFGDEFEKRQSQLQRIKDDIKPAQDEIQGTVKLLDDLLSPAGALKNLNQTSKFPDIQFNDCSLEDVSNSLSRIPEWVPQYQKNETISIGHIKLDRYRDEQKVSDLVTHNSKWQSSDVDIVVRAVVCQFIIEGISSLKEEESLFSPTVEVWGLPWRLVLKRTTRGLGIFLQCCVDVRTEWSCQASFQLELVPPQNISIISKDSKDASPMSDFETDQSDEEYEPLKPADVSQGMPSAGFSLGTAKPESPFVSEGWRSNANATIASSAAGGFTFGAPSYPALGSAVPKPPISKKTPKSLKQEESILRYVTFKPPQTTWGFDAFIDVFSLQRYTFDDSITLKVTLRVKEPDFPWFRQFETDMESSS